MDETVRFGTIAGIRVGANWSVLAIFGLLLLGLAAGRFPLLYPDRSPLAYAIAGGAAAVAFLGSLLAHEIAHAVVARREGLQVDGITLWLFGGVARLTGEAGTPAADLRIAGVGPAVSLGLGLAFGALRWAVAGAGGEGLLLGVLSWLALINLVLAAFNLVPAAPLDGGRILRALLWRHHGDRVRAAISASRAGRSFGLALVGLGVVLVLVVPGVGGLWLALIGWFIASAARAEEQHANLQSALSGLRVADVMSHDPVTVTAPTSVAELLDRYVLRHRHSSYPVTDAGGRPRGLVTLHQVREVPTDQRASTSVADVAVPLERAARARPSDPLLDVLEGLGPTGDARILVIDDDRVVGILSASDVTRRVELSRLLRPRM